MVEQELKRRVLSNEVVFGRLKKLILLRERERSTRENSIKILKKLVKFDKQACVLLLALKVEVLISFILEREYKHAQVLKEREQSFKLILAWLEHDPATFPYLLGQTVATIARNAEDTQLRKMGIEAILTLCHTKPDMGASVGGIKIMVDTILDVSLA